MAQDEQDASSEEEQEAIAAPKPKKNAFDLLNAFDEEDEGESLDHEPQVDTEPAPVAATTTETSKKKKKKKKKAAAATKSSKKTAEAEELDDIDRALKELSTKDGAATALNEPPTATTANVDGRFAKTPEELLSIDPRSLNAMNEMRKLFGNVVLESFDEENSGSGRRRERQRETIDLGRALSGRYSPASRGQSLAGVALRKNVLMRGNDEWPRVTSGGLGMELTEKLPSGNSLYRLLHNQAYQDVQMQFDLCVESMDPQRLIHLLQYNRKSFCPPMLRLKTCS